MSHRWAVRRLDDAWESVVFAVCRACLGVLSPRRRLRFGVGLAKVAALDFPDSPLYVRVATPKQLARTKECAKEPETVDWLRANLRPGDVFYDVGANTGAYSLVANAILSGSGKVFSFEPGAFTFSGLVDNLSLNDCATVVPFQVALSDGTELRPMEYYAGGTGQGVSFEPKDDAAKPSAFRVMTVCYRLDDLCRAFSLPAPCLMKIDTDRSEASVLRGAAQTLRDPALRTVLIEMDANDEASTEAGRLLEEAGFRVASRHPRPSAGVSNTIYARP
ncbi:MAG: FkbM family methyltransferase [Fimbriimonadaceae bacterium]|nr:FkbM family methyltransferase [Fimbriimonadaceae bacterium]